MIEGKVAEWLWRMSQVFENFRLGIIRLLQTSGEIRVGSSPTLLSFFFPFLLLCFGLWSR